MRQQALQCQMPVAIVFDITGTPEMFSDCLSHVNYVVNIPGYIKQRHLIHLDVMNVLLNLEVNKTDCSMTKMTNKLTTPRKTFLFHVN